MQNLVPVAIDKRRQKTITTEAIQLLQPHFKRNPVVAVHLHLQRALDYQKNQQTTTTTTLDTIEKQVIHTDQEVIFINK